MDRLNRRVFLGRTLGSLALLAGPGAPTTPAAPREAAVPLPCAPKSWHKHGPILEPTENWEGAAIQNFTSPAEPLGGDRWRIWYSASGENHSIAFAEGIPGGPMQRFPAQCTPGEPGDGSFVVGHLPERWRPVQVVHLRLLNGRHRIYFWAHGPAIARYLAADSEDGRRYTVIDPHRPVLYHPHDRAAHGVASPDGVMMKDKLSLDRPVNEPLAVPRLISNDATNIYQLPDGSFEMYSTALMPVPKSDPAYWAHDNAPGLLRVIDRYTSPDGVRFENRQRVIQRDDADPADQQFYHLAVTFTPKGSVGMLGHYRCQAQTMDLEWCFSADGATWQRPRRRAWLARGNNQQPDSYGIYPPSALVHHAGQWHLFYTGVNSAHNGKHSYGPARSVIMHATTKSIWA